MQSLQWLAIGRFREQTGVYPARQVFAVYPAQLRVSLTWNGCPKKIQVDHAQKQYYYYIWETIEDIVIETYRWTYL